ncbi:MAG: hypothetical protein ABSB74_06655 [Tepidisphaeraceae bacterium]
MILAIEPTFSYASLTAFTAAASSAQPAPLAAPCGSRSRTE